MEHFESLVQAQEPAIRLGAFLGIFALMALWELAAPRRALTVSKALRWGSNLGLVVLNTVLMRLLFPVAAVAMAGLAEAQGWGLLNRFDLPAVILFEVILSGMALFNHANVRLPLGLDRRLRWVLVTPDMHRVHHSVEADETNSNFGFNLSIWDRLLGTYRDQPRAGHEAMTLGIDDHRDPREVDLLPGMLALPFRGEVRDGVQAGDAGAASGLVARDGGHAVKAAPSRDRVMRWSPGSLRFARSRRGGAPTVLPTSAPNDGHECGIADEPGGPR